MIGTLSFGRTKESVNDAIEQIRPVEGFDHIFIISICDASNLIASLVYNLATIRSENGRKSEEKVFGLTKLFGNRQMARI